MFPVCKYCHVFVPGQLLSSLSIVELLRHNTTWWQRSAGMASIRLQPPDPFDFRRPDDWPKWKRCFEQYRSASRLSAEDDLRQVSTLLYCLGEEVDDVFTSTNAADNRKVYNTVLAKLDGFFQVRRNVIFQRAKFNRRNQLDGESAEQYITALYSLVETCEYGALKEEMLQDRLVVGIKDTALSERLQTDAELTLEKAKKSIRQKEAVKEQHRLLQGGGPVNKDYCQPRRGVRSEATPMERWG